MPRWIILSLFFMVQSANAEVSFETLLNVFASQNQSMNIIGQVQMDWLDQSEISCQHFDERFSELNHIDNIVSQTFKNKATFNKQVLNNFENIYLRHNLYLRGLEDKKILNAKIRWNLADFLPEGVLALPKSLRLVITKGKSELSLAGPIVFLENFHETLTGPIYEVQLPLSLSQACSFIGIKILVLIGCQLDSLTDNPVQQCPNSELIELSADTRNSYQHLIRPTHHRSRLGDIEVSQ